LTRHRSRFSPKAKPNTKGEEETVYNIEFLTVFSEVFTFFLASFFFSLSKTKRKKNCQKIICFLQSFEKQKQVIDNS